MVVYVELGLLGNGGTSVMLSWFPLGLGFRVLGCGEWQTHTVRSTSTLSAMQPWLFLVRATSGRLRSFALMRGSGGFRTWDLAFRTWDLGLKMQGRRWIKPEELHVPNK